MLPRSFVLNIQHFVYSIQFLHRRLSPMSFRRKLGAACAVVLIGVGVPSWGQGWAWLPFGSGSTQAASHDSGAVQKDDSHLTVVQARAESDIPLVDTATKKKKPSSFWSSKIFHPTQWFSSSKKK
jgi:hypothetical protein